MHTLQEHEHGGHSRSTSMTGSDLGLSTEGMSVHTGAALERHRARWAPASATMQLLVCRQPGLLVVCMPGVVARMSMGVWHSAAAACSLLPIPTVLVPGSFPYCSDLSSPDHFNHPDPPSPLLNTLLCVLRCAALRRKPGVSRQLAVLFWRAWVDMVRNPALLRLHILIGSITGVLMGFVFWDLKMDQIGERDGP